MDHLTQVIELEIELQRIAVEGENIFKYYNENSEKKLILIGEYNKFKDKVVNSSIANSYKNSMLGSANEYLNKLTPPSSENKAADSLLYLIVGVLAGAVFVDFLGKSWANFEEGMVDGLTKGLYNGTVNVNGQTGPTL